MTDAVPTPFATRYGGSWLDTSVPGGTPQPIDLEGVRALLDAARPLEADRPARRSADPDPDAADAVAPAWCWVGRAAPEGLVVEGPDGRPELLDLVDLALIDEVDRPRAVPALAARHGDDAWWRLGRLVALGLLERRPGGGAEAAEAAEADAADDVDEGADPGPPDPASGLGRRLATAYRLSSKLAPLRRALGEGAHRTLERAETMGTAAAAPEPAPGPRGALASPIHPEDHGPEGRVPVYAIWHDEMGPLLSLGMLTSAARHHDGGALGEHYEIRRPESARSFLADRAQRRGPAIVLLSDYVWSLDANLELARQARAEDPDLLFVHGGPSSPKYPGDAEAFLRANRGLADVLVRGEGEEVVCELLEALRPTSPGGPLVVDPDRLATIGGLSFLGADDQVVRTPDRERIPDLNVVPSPYLTGEYDHIPTEAWCVSVTLEGNRGCPFGCTYCDWGSSTLSRVRRYDLERILDELRWTAEKGIESVFFADANFGMFRYDIDIAERAVELRAATGFPRYLLFTPAKNNIRHLVRVTETLVRGDVGLHAALGFQTTDPDTLAAIDRTNISLDAYLRLAADYRRHALPLSNDQLLGLPLQDYEKFLTDLQFHLDHEILIRVWSVKSLPNAPMNAPEYRERYGIVVDDRGVVVATSSFDEAERQRMLDLRHAFVAFESFGILRHVARWLQWDHGVPGVRFFDSVLRAAQSRPDRYPALAWILGYFDIMPARPGSWRALYDEVADLVEAEHGISASSALATVLAVQVALMPGPGRRLPDEVALPHDYVAYYRDATASLYTDGTSSVPPRPLHEYPPGTLPIWGDPLGVCERGPGHDGDSRNEVVQSQYYSALSTAYELDSPLARLLPHVSAHFPPTSVQRLLDRYRPEVDAWLAAEEERARTAPTKVQLLSSRRG